MDSPLRIVIVGAGPAGLAAAKIGVALGYVVDVFEKHRHPGGIWNPYSRGAYKNVRLQTSRMAFHFSDHPATAFEDTDFLSRQQFYEYLHSYIERFGIASHIHYGTEVIGIRRSGGWEITVRKEGKTSVHICDRVIVANGELWRSRLLPGTDRNRHGTAISAKEYETPEAFTAKKVLVIGGGVSGADISAEISTLAKEVHWSIRNNVLLLPRMWGNSANDSCFSYVGRYAVQRWDRLRYVQFLEERLPEYMRLYGATNLIPDSMINNAIHINDSAVRAVANGAVQVKRGAESFVGDRMVRFLDGTTESYDVIIMCMGYEPPDYTFIQDFSVSDLYEHFFYWKDPTLAILNTPVHADGYGTACPFFEGIAYWIFEVFGGRCKLPSKRDMMEWCNAWQRRPRRKVFYDCWLETIRIGLISGQLPDPVVEFASYWQIVSSIMTPVNLQRSPSELLPAPFDSLVDMNEMKLRILSSVPENAMNRLIESNQITADVALQADKRRHLAIEPGLC